jgi:hypothetical protein
MLLQSCILFSGLQIQAKAGIDELSGFDILTGRPPAFLLILGFSTSLVVCAQEDFLHTGCVATGAARALKR